MFTGMIFVATAAFNNTGRPIYSTGINWVREGLVTLPLALWLSSIYGASGVIMPKPLWALFWASSPRFGPIDLSRVLQKPTPADIFTLSKRGSRTGMI